MRGRFQGGPIRRYGGKGLMGEKIVSHFPEAATYLEPFFGAGSVFYAIPPGKYPHEVVNDLDSSLTTFFRVLRTRTEELALQLSRTPHSLDEFAACLEHSPDELEEARRVWVRSRQGFSGVSSSRGKWGRNVAGTGGWPPHKTETKLSQLDSYAERLRGVVIDNTDAVEFLDRWARGDCFVYADPPYPHETRGTTKDYSHEMNPDQHRLLAESLNRAVARGCKVAVSSYDCDLYRELYAGWRIVQWDQTLQGNDKSVGVQKRVETMFLSYGRGDVPQQDGVLELFL